jgi:hypothetical protein
MLRYVAYSDCIETFETRMLWNAAGMLLAAGVAFALIGLGIIAWPALDGGAED